MHDFGDEFFSHEYERYAQARDKGLRKQANAMLEKLMLYFDGLDESARETICGEFCALRFEEGKMRDFQFFLSQRIEKFLEGACAKNRMPHLRWYYQLARDYAMLEKAYAHAQRDEKTVELMLGACFSDLWYGAHHFSEYCLFDKETCERSLEETGRLVREHNPGEKLQESYLRYKAMYSDWWAYKAENPDYDFREWCARQGRKYKWVAAYYYQNGKQAGREGGAAREFGDEYFSREYERYARMLDRGSKKQANAIGEKLALYFDGLDEGAQKAICDGFCFMHFEGAGKAGAVQYDLSRRFEKILQDACAKNRMPHLRWHYQLTQNREMLEKAYAHDERDERTVGLMASARFEDLLHGAHHFPHSCLFDKETCDRLLEETGRLVERHDLRKEFKELHLAYKDLYADWWAHDREKPDCGFDEWCARQGRDYGWLRARHHKTVKN